MSQFLSNRKLLHEIMGYKYIGANRFGFAMLYDQSEDGGGGVGSDAILSRKSHVN